MKKFVSNGDITMVYPEHDGIIGFQIIPTALLDKYKEKECIYDSLIQLKLVGDAYSGRCAQGVTMRNSESVSNLKFLHQDVTEDNGITQVEMVFTNDKNHTVKHVVVCNGKTVSVHNEFINTGNTRATLEMISSFSSGMLSPFSDDEDLDVLKLHRMRSYWSAEGALESRDIEEFGLENSWGGNHGPRVQRYGQIGSLPVRGFFPFAALTDTKNNVTWAVQLSIASSWQIEVYKINKGLSISGGIADREFGHWLKHVEPGDNFVTPYAVFTVCMGGVDEASNRVVNHIRPYLDTLPDCEKELPIIFNEYCTTWGNPTHDNIKKIADVLKGKGVKYFVIDAGWYCADDWSGAIGDWELSAKRFPNSLKVTADYIKQCGMIPGIWFEFESVADGSKAFNMTDHLLKRDGEVLTSGDRRFWDMSDPWVTDYLTGKVIDTLKENGFGYIKVDYNDCIGFGCDGVESLGEGLRQRILSTQKFFKKIKEEIPDIVIENCSSGGHRLEMSMMNLVSQASFSDAHECKEIPVIAANLHRAIHPAQSQIWAVLKKQHTEKDIYYRLTSAFLGRICLSGDVYDLDDKQWEIVERGLDFYKKIVPIIKNGESKRYGNSVKIYSHPNGYQAMLREYDGKAMLIIHTFYDPPKEICLDLGYEEIEDVFSLDSNFSIKNGMFTYKPDGEFEGGAFILK